MKWHWVGRQSDWEVSALAALEFAAIDMVAWLANSRDLDFELPRTFLPLVHHEALKLHQLGCDLESMALRTGVFFFTVSH